MSLVTFGSSGPSDGFGCEGGDGVLVAGRGYFLGLPLPLFLPGRITVSISLVFSFVFVCVIEFLLERFRAGDVSVEGLAVEVGLFMLRRFPSLPPSWLESIFFKGGESVF